MPATQLSLYNGALGLLKSRALSTAFDNTPERHHLDAVYSGAKAFVLEQAQWSWASVSTSIAGSASANRGFAYRITKPTDFCRLIAISSSSSYYPPLEEYAEDANYWYADASTVYVTYTSKATASATVTITLATPGVISWTAHGFVADDPVSFTTTGTLPTGITASTTYYVLSTGLTADTFRIAATPGGTAINTSVSQSGVHTGRGLSGGNLSNWPETYAKVVESYLAMEVAPHLSKADAITDRAEAAYAAALQISTAKDAINRTVRVTSSATTETYKAVLRLLGNRLIKNFDDKIVGRRIYDANGAPATRESGGQGPSLPAYDAEVETILRRLIDEAYEPAIDYLLEQGLWNFGSRTVAIEAETDVEPAFGYSYTFEKPDDYVRIIRISDNGTMWPTLDLYEEEGNYWHANVDPLYLQYVSSGASYGRNTSLWPASFKKALEAYLALEVAPHAPRMSGRAIEYLQDHYRRCLRDARGKDAINQSNERPPPGRLVTARLNGKYGRGQRREN